MLEQSFSKDGVEMQTFGDSELATLVELKLLKGNELSSLLHCRWPGEFLYALFDCREACLLTNSLDYFCVDSSIQQKKSVLLAARATAPSGATTTDTGGGKERRVRAASSGTLSEHSERVFSFNDI